LQGVLIGSLDPRQFQYKKQIKAFKSKDCRLLFFIQKPIFATKSQKRRVKPPSACFLFKKAK